MIVLSVDDTNLQLAMESLQAKALRALVRQATPAQLTAAAAMMQLDSHPYSAEDVATVARQFVLALRRVATALNGRTIKSDTEDLLAGASDEVTQ